MIDIKRLLYKYRKNEVKLSNIQSSLTKFIPEYPSCTPAYNDDIKPRGGLPQSQTERFALHNVMKDNDRRERLIDNQRYAEEAISLVRNAVGTLNQIQRDLIDFRYFQDRTPEIVATMLNMSVHNFWKLHKIAYEGIEECLNFGEIECGNNPFIPQKKEKAKILAKNMANVEHEIAV
jgi:DNA-directed RNA polymerase specialized sigma24 family protein